MPAFLISSSSVLHDRHLPVLIARASADALDRSLTTSRPARHRRLVFRTAEHGFCACACAWTVRRSPTSRVLILSNHVSWLDIPVHRRRPMPLVFISKSEVRNWPLVGAGRAIACKRFSSTARAGRKPPRSMPGSRASMSGGDPVVLFAEGTSSDGNRVLQFRSALVGAASDGRARRAKGDVCAAADVDQLYRASTALPMGREHRPLRRLVRRHGFRAAPERLRAAWRRSTPIVTFGEPIAFDGGDRKSMVKSLETAVRRDAHRGLARRLFAESGLKSRAFLFAAKTAMKWPNGAARPAWNHGMSEIFEPLKASGPFGAARLTAHRAA